MGKIDYNAIYNNVFSTKQGYNVHIKDKDRYDFVINEVTNNGYHKIIDISSGRGYLLKYLKESIKDIDITSTDLEKFNDYDVSFVKMDLSKEDEYNNIQDTYDFLSCLDVLEHLDIKHTNGILSFFSKLSDNVCLTVANHSDMPSGIQLHLVQENKTWWDNIISIYFTIDSSFSNRNGDLYSYVLKSKNK